MTPDEAEFNAWQLLPDTNRRVMEILVDDLMAPPEYIATMKVINVIMREES